MLSWNEAVWFSILIGTALKSTVVLGVACLSAFLLRGRSAAARHLVWTAAAAAVLALPLLSIALPVLPVPGTALLPSAGTLFEATATASADGGILAVRALGNTAAATSVRVAPWRPDWRIGVMLLWAAGAVIVSLRMMVACAAMWRVRRAARPFSDRQLQGDASQALGIGYPVEVLETPTGSMPMTFGLLRSAVFMPSDAALWSEERRRVVLLHELAHVRRGDVATHLLARTALALYWWNPLAWTAWRQFLKERERAADDLVLRAGAKPSEYAGHLLEVARTMRPAPAGDWAAISMARRSQLEGRLLAILDSQTDRRTASRASAWVAALLAVLVVAPVAAVRAQDNPTPAVQAEVDATIRAALSQKNHQILEQAAAAFENLRQFDTAQKLLETAVEIRGEVSGQQSLEYGVGLLKLADLEQTRRNTKVAEDFYAKAAAVLGERPEASRPLIQMGIASLITGDFDQAEDRFQHAQRLDPDAAGTAMMWLAVVNERQKKFDEADALYQSSLALLDPKSHEAATTMQLYSALLKMQGRTDESAEMISRAKAAQKTSETHAIPAAAPSGVYKVSGGVTAPRVLKKIDPLYSDEARAAKYQGTVLVSVVIGSDGLAHNAQVLQGLGLGLDQRAIDAISQWQFQPGTKDGQPVPVAATIEVNFRLL